MAFNFSLSPSRFSPWLPTHCHLSVFPASKSPDFPRNFFLLESPKDPVLVPLCRSSMAKRSSTKEEDEQKEEDAEHYEDHDSDEDVEGGGEEEEEEQQQQQQELEYGRKKVMIRVVSAGQRLSAFVPFVNGTSSSTSGIGSLLCQADECGADLRMVKAYHKRHKVCEHHAKAAVVLVSGVRQRFCQQCSKFHEVSQFDDNKKSCREKLAGHNERRRKTQSEHPAEDGQKQPELKIKGSLMKAAR